MNEKKLRSKRKTKKPKTPTFYNPKSTSKKKSESVSKSQADIYSPNSKEYKKSIPRII